jgi:hypothetical protein
VAQEVVIAGTNQTAKVRSPLGVAALSLITLGIYYLYWYWRVNVEMSDLGQSRGEEELGETPLISLLAVTLGALLIVPPFVSIFHTGQRLNKAQHMTGERVGFSPILGLVLAILLFPVFAAIVQNGANNVWVNQARR